MRRALERTDGVSSLAILGFIAAALVSACTGAGDKLSGLGEALACGLSRSCLPTPALPTVVIIGTAGPIAIGETVQFSAQVRDSLGVLLGGRTFQWRSLDPNKASVNATGLVRAIGVGDVQIWVTAMPDGVSASRLLTIVSGASAVETVEVQLDRGWIIPGEATIAVATTLDARGYALKGRLVAWSTSDANVATVESTGMVRGVAPGSAIIRATSEGRNGEAMLMVTGVAPEVSFRLEGIYSEQEQSGASATFPYSVNGQSVRGVVWGRYTIRHSMAYPSLKDENGPLTCLRLVDSVIVAGMYPSSAFGPNVASYIMIKDRHSTPLVFAGGSNWGDSTIARSKYCEPATLSSMIRTMPASRWKPGVTRLEYP